MTPDDVLTPDRHLRPALLASISAGRDRWVDLRCIAEPNRVSEELIRMASLGLIEQRNNRWSIISASASTHGTPFRARPDAEALPTPILGEPTPSASDDAGSGGVLQSQEDTPPPVGSGGVDLGDDSSGAAGATASSGPAAPGGSPYWNGPPVARQGRSLVESCSHPSTTTQHRPDGSKLVLCSVCGDEVTPTDPAAAAVVTPCTECGTPLLYSARVGGRKLCGPCGRFADGTDTAADRTERARRPLPGPDRVTHEELASLERRADAGWRRHEDRLEALTSAFAARQAPQPGSLQVALDRCDALELQLQESVNAWTEGLAELQRRVEELSQLYAGMSDRLQMAVGDAETPALKERIRIVAFLLFHQGCGVTTLAQRVADGEHLKGEVGQW